LHLELFEGSDIVGTISPEDTEQGRWLYSGWRHISEYKVWLRQQDSQPWGTLDENVMTLAKDASIDRQQLTALLLPQLQTLGIVSIDSDAKGPASDGPRPCPE
jgi:hypothetical protein